MNTATTKSQRRTLPGPIAKSRGRLRNAGISALLGVALGLAGALAATRVLASLVYGVSTTDPLTMAATAAILLGAAALASWVPAMRAARVDPAVSLRSE